MPRIWVEPGDVYWRYREEPFWTDEPEWYRTQSVDGLVRIPRPSRGHVDVYHSVDADGAYQHTVIYGPPANTIVRRRPIRPRRPFRVREFQGTQTWPDVTEHRFEAVHAHDREDPPAMYRVDERGHWVVDVGVPDVPMPSIEWQIPELPEGAHMPRGEQLSFLNDPRFPPRFLTVNESQIEPTREAPNPPFVENIERLGIVLPIALIDAQGESVNYNYRIADGRRRVAAARTLGLVHVPAMVYPPGTPPQYAAAMTVSTNFHRRPNPLSELEAIETLMAGGHTEEQVATALRLSVMTVRSRMRLAPLAPYLRDQVRIGALSVTAAALIAQLPRARQQEINRRIQSGERLTATAVRAEFFPSQDPAQMTSGVEAPTPARLGFDATGQVPADVAAALRMTGWDARLAVLEIMVRDIELPADSSPDSAEIYDIVDTLNELIGMMSPFTQGAYEGEPAVTTRV